MPRVPSSHPTLLLTVIPLWLVADTKRLAARALTHEVTRPFGKLMMLILIFKGRVGREWRGPG